MNNYYFYKILYTILLITLYITKSIHVYAQGNEIDKKKILIKNQYEMMENYFPNQTILTGSAEVLWLLCNNGNIENDNIHIPNDTDFVITSKGQTPLKNIGDYENEGGVSLGHQLLYRITRVIELTLLEKKQNRAISR